MDAFFSPTHLVLLFLLAMLAIPVGVIALVIFIVVKKYPPKPPANPTHNP
jgi:hypothetical protein